MKAAIIFFAFALTLLQSTGTLHAQSGQTLYGDIRVDESKAVGLRAHSLDVILYSEGGVVLSRQTVSSSGRYRFNNLGLAMYVLSVESEGTEVAHLRVDLRLPMLGDFKQDIELEWKDTSAATAKAATISAADVYVRSPANQSLFEKAREAADKKHYTQAIELLSQLVKVDPKDFQAWTELANNHYLIKSFAESENEYLRALDLHANFFLALLNLGRLEVAQQKYEMALDVLTRAIQVNAVSADANYLMGESCLQIKKGSLAVKYFNESLRLDPVGMAEVHLRLATLYIKAGLSGRAVTEYEEFLKKRPASPDRKKLEEFINTNRSKAQTP